MQAQTTKTTSRSTIGVLTSGLEDQYQISILRGAITTAQEQNVNLVVYSGGELDSPVKDRIGGNVIYDLATDDSTANSTIDALVIFTGTLMGFVDPDRQLEFCSRFSVPKVSIGLTLPNAHNVLLDNEYGMRTAIRHLIADHGYRHVAFIQGPEGNGEAGARFQAYLNTLEACGVPFDPQLVVAGKFQIEDGAEAVRILLDERNVAVEAIVSANDNMAIGALDELQKRAIPVPGRIAVIGFDDIDDARATIPTLTTVRQPLSEQGKCGVEIALALLRGETVVNPFTLNPELVVRRSCGCFSLATVDLPVQRENGASDGASIEKLLVDSKTVSVANMLSVMPNTRNFRWIENLYDAFLEDLFRTAETEKTGLFLEALDAITREILIEDGQIQSWHEILTTMRREMAPLLGMDVQLHIRAENLWQQGRIVISEAIQHAEAHQQLRVKNQAQALNAIGEPLLTVTNMADLAKVMADGLPRLGVKSCYIALYEDASREWAHLVFSYDQDHDQTGASNTDIQGRFPSRELLPQPLLRASRRYSFLVEALHFDNIQFGFVVLEIEQPQAYIYEALRKQISSTLHTASIMRELEEKHTLLETALERLRSTQAMLIHSEKMNSLGQMVAGVAHEINNPIAFVNSNVHSLGATFEELVAAYDSLENYVRTIASPDAVSVLASLRQQGGLDFLIDDTRDLIKQTLNGLKRVKDIVTELRKFSRLDEAEFKVSNLRENIESAILIASGELRNRVTVEVNIDPTLSLFCAAAELNQVFLNLITNAAQAIEGQGTITITATENEHEVVIEFSDTGSGIPEHVIGHIFDPFFTTKPVGVGTGLGLAILHKIIVDSHKGSVNVESKPGSGAKFTIRLPKEIRT